MNIDSKIINSFSKSNIFVFNYPLIALPVAFSKKWSLFNRK
jgi:hypothetical protein